MPGLQHTFKETTAERRAQVQRDLLTDSLNFYQVTRNAAFNAGYNFGADDNKQTLGFAASYQTGVGRKEYSIEPESATDFLNLAVSHRFSLKNSGISLNSAFSFASSGANGIGTIFYGPIAGITKSFWDKKGKVGYRASWQQVKVDGLPGSSVIINAVTGSLQMFEKHGLSAGMQYLVKGGTASFSEMRGTVGYMFQF